MTTSYVPGQGDLFSRAGLVGSALAALAEALQQASDAAPSVTLLEARTMAAQHLASIEAVTPLSLERFTALWARFERFALHGFDVSLVAEVDADLVRAFVMARTSGGHIPSGATSHLRRTAVRLLFRVLRDLRLAAADPTLDLSLPTRTKTLLRPLTNEEIELCRWASLDSLFATRRPAVWALAESGASTTEIGRIRVADLDLAKGRVWLAGGPKTDARWAQLTEWGKAQVGRRVREMPDRTSPSRRVTFDGCGDDHSHRTSTVQALRFVLRRAGLGGEREVHPRSVAAWVGSTVFSDTGRIDEVARRLGLRSLDLTAELIGFQWRDADRQ